MEEKTCCVTGHRDIPDEQIDAVKYALRREIVKAVSDGYTGFMTGFANGADQYFAEIVVILQKDFPELRLIAVLPYWNGWTVCARRNIQTPFWMPVQRLS